MLPVKPSQTITSPAPSSRSRLSALPAKPTAPVSSSPYASSVSWLPFSGSSPMESSRTSGRGISRMSSAKIDAHVSELEQVLRAAVGVRAAVEEDERAATPRRDRHGDRRPHHTRDAPEVEQPCGQHRAGVAGREDGVRPSLGDRDVGGDERGVRLRAHGVCRLLVHLDHVGRLDELETVRFEPGGAEEHELDPLGGGVQRARDDLVRRPVASHRIDRDRGPRLRSRGAERLDLAAAVRLAGRADVMRPLGLMAGRADVDARRVDAVLRAPLVAAGLGGLFLGDGHERQAEYS